MRAKGHPYGGTDLRNAFKTPEGSYQLKSEWRDGQVLRAYFEAGTTGRRVADGREKGDYVILNVGEALHILRFEEDELDSTKTIYFRREVCPTCHCFAPASDGADVLVGLSNGEVMLLSLRSMLQGSSSTAQVSPIAVFNGTSRFEEEVSCTSVVWTASTQPTHFVATYADGNLRIFEKSRAGVGTDGRVIRGIVSEETMNIGGGCIHDTAISPDGTKLAVVSKDGLLRIFDSHSRLLQTGFQSYYGGLLCCAWSPDGKYVATGGEDDLVAVFSVEQSRVVAFGEGHSSWISQVSFDSGVAAMQDTNAHEPSSLIYRVGSVSQDTQVALWDFEVDLSLPTPRASAVSSPRHPTSNGVAEESETLCMTPAIPHRDMVIIPPVMLHKLHPDPVTDVVFTPSRMFTCDCSGHVRYWTKPTAQSGPSRRSPSLSNSPALRSWNDYWPILRCGPRSLAPPPRMAFNPAAQVSRSQSFYDNPATIAEQFYEATNSRRTMNLWQFVRATGCKSDVFARKLFGAMDTNDSGDITFDEFLDGLQRLRSPNHADRIAFVFGIFDLDGDGVISGAELKTVLAASVEEEGGILTDEENSTLVESLLQLFGTDAASSISYAEFDEVIRTYPDLLSGLSFGHFGTRSSGQSATLVSKRFRRVRKATSWLINNPQRVVTYTTVLVLMAGCFLWRFLKYAGDCSGADMDAPDPLTGYSRHDVMDLAKVYDTISVRLSDIGYMVFSKSMAARDPIECRDARKRMLLGWTLPVAKGCGQAMKVTFTLILLPVSRNLMTTLRDTLLKHVFHFDGAIEFHRFLGKVGFLLAWVHALCHVVDVINWQDPDRYRYWSWAFPDDRPIKTMHGIQRNASGSPMYDSAGHMMYEGAFRDGLPVMLYPEAPQPCLKDILTSCFALTGMLLLAIYSFAALFAFDYPKKLTLFRERPTDTEKPWRQWVVSLGRWLNDFNNFWYSHHLFTLFYIALFFHPLPHIPDERNEWGWSDTWLWVGIPVVIYLTEWAVRVKRSASNTRVVSAELLDGDVVGLRVLRPRGFKYTPGQYVFINCPQISRFEWHPFTLTSCPGDSYLGVHVRKAGDWTGALHALVERHAKEKTGSLSDSSGNISVMSKYCVRPVVGTEFEVQERFDFSIAVDGPFGAPAQNYADYRVIVLIGAGIGVTPFASVLTDLLDSLRQCACPKCGYSNKELLRVRVRKVYFYWTVRSRSEASWFKNLLEAISQMDEDGLLDIQINITGIKKANDLRTMMLSIAQYECGEATTSDAHARTVTRFGRIDWNEVFRKVKTDFPGEPTVGVFYCGPNTISKILSKKCRENSKGPTKFLFMQESFG